MNENYDEDLEYQRAAEERRKRDSKDAVTREI